MSNHNGFRAPKVPGLPINSTTAPRKKSKFSDVPPSGSNSNIPDLSVPRKSKFSDQPPGVIPPPTKINAAAIAAAAAAKINASLRAKGKLSGETLLQPKGNTTSNLSALIQISETNKIFDSFVAKVDINDLPIAARTHFTQVSIQESVNKQTGAAVSTKGQFLLASEKKNLSIIEKQLHLYIQSPFKEKVDHAVAKLKEMILKYNLPHPKLSVSDPIPAPIAPNNFLLNQPTLPTGSYVQEKIFVGLDFIHPDFDLKTKLIGVNYTNFNFVANSTGAKVILRGRGSGFLEPTCGREAFESMYVFISHVNHAGVDAAKKLVQNLIDTVHSEYAAYNAVTPSGFVPNTNFAAPSAMITNSGTFPTPPVQTSAMAGPGNNYANPGMFPNSYAGNNTVLAAPQNNTKSKVGNPYNISPPTNNFTPPLPPAPDNKNSHKSHSNSSNNIQNNSKVESNATKRRRFQEKIPDDSDLLGYKQISNKSDEVLNKKPKRSFKEDLLKEKPNDIVENNKNSISSSKSKTGMPFWMSHSYD